MSMITGLGSWGIKEIAPFASAISGLDTRKGYPYKPTTFEAGALSTVIGAVSLPKD